MGTVQTRPSAPENGTGKKMQRRELKKPILFACGALVLLAAVIALLTAQCGSSRSLIGTWDYDTVTVYRFGTHGKGSLTLPMGSFDFSYRTEEDMLFIDFVSETAADGQYTYYVYDNTLTLQGDGFTYVLERIKEQTKGMPN